MSPNLVPLAPRAQPVDSARALANDVAALNRDKLSLDERLRILEIVGTSADDLRMSLDRLYADSPQPLAADAREAFITARALAAALAGAYKIAIAQEARERISRGVQRPLPPLLLRAMHHLAEGMRTSYKSYAPIPAGAWKEMHALYLYAEQEGVAATAVDAATNATVAGLYCESLLLSLTDPYRLAVGELDRVLRLLRGARVAPILGKARPDTRASAHFLVPCDEDKPPKPALLAHEDTVGLNWRVLDANPVVEALRALPRDAGVRDPLIGKLIALWGDPPKRVFRRDPAVGSVAICVGVKAIAQFVAHDATADAEEEARALREGITMPLRTLPEDESGRLVPIHEWAVINHSEGGLKVRRSASSAHPIAVGEVVGIRAPSKALWTIGVARWITALDDGTTEFGVQFFASAICAVWVKQANSPTPHKLGVLLADGAEVSSESLLTPPDTWSEQGIFALQGEDFRSRVCASDLVEKNARFEVFRVDPV